MKKLISMIMIISFIFALCACSVTDYDGGDNHNHEEEHNHTHVEETTAVVADTDIVVPTNESAEPVIPGVNDDDKSGTIHPVDTEGHYKADQIAKIDVPCAEELEKAQSDASRIVIYNTYSEEWAEVAERYCSELLKIKGTVPATENYSTDEEMHEYLEFCMQEWTDLMTQRKTTFEGNMIDGADNTAVELMAAQVYYEINREYALYFIDIYENIEAFSNQGN